MTKELAPDGAFCIEQNTQEYLDKQLDMMLADTSSDISTKDKIEMARLYVDGLGLNIRETNALVTAVVSDSKVRYVNSEEYNPEYKWTTPMSVAGLNYMLETSCSAEQALQHVKNVYEKDDLWLTNTRNKPLPKKVRVNSINSVEGDNKVKIKHLKTVSHYKKKKLLSATTPSRQMNEMQEVITVADRVDRLENLAKEQGDEILELRSELHDLKFRVELSEHNIKTIGEVMEIKTINLKDEVMLLKDKYTIEQIAQILNIKERKVKYLMYGK